MFAGFVYCDNVYHGFCFCSYAYVLPSSEFIVSLVVHAAMERVPDDGETSPGFECRLERERARSGEYFGLWAVALDCFVQVESDLWLRSV